MHPESAPATEKTGMRIGYVLSEYPKVSHTFIRREILALEQQGIEVERMGIRDGGAVVDALDQAEAQRTRYVLAQGAAGLLLAGLQVLLRSPHRAWQAFVLACRMGWKADRPMPFHWIYLLEAAVIARWVSERSITHLHAHFGSNPAEVAMLAARLAGITYSFTAHGTVETDNARAIGLTRKVHEAQFVIAVSHYGRAQMMRWVPVGQWSRIHVVRCGLGPEYLNTPITPAPQALAFLAIGRLSEEKGHACLVDAFAEVLATGVSARLVLAGDGPLRATLQRRCQELGIEEHVHITGWVSGEQVQALLKASTALVLPSFAEGLPVVLMEAMAMGRPVVASWVAGIPELVKQDHNGWLVPPADVRALARAMLDCASAGADRLEDMGRAGKAAVSQWHDSQIESQRLATLLRQAHAPG